MGFENIRIRRRHVIGLAADLLLFTLESGFKSIRIRCRIRGMHVDRSRIWKEKVADSNYADSCGRGLRDEFSQKHHPESTMVRLAGYHGTFTRY